MTNQTFTQSQKRFQESLGSLFDSEAEKTCLFLKSSTDQGVIRNGGRNGARFAPASFLATFKKFTQTERLRSESFLEMEVSDDYLEKSDFRDAQKEESGKIRLAVSQYPEARVVHIGGGHDHVYPLLKALSHNYKKVIAINIDAHADTRTDENPHSGTPFRQFASEFQGEFRLYQIGLHPFANSFSTLTNLEKGFHDILWMKDVSKEELEKVFGKISGEVTPETLVVFSIDADGLSGFEVPGVSAVNPAGLSRKQLLEIWDKYASLPLNHSPVLGIYELNPIYDTLAAVSMRTMGSFVFETFEKR